MNIKSLLLGSAAALAAVSGAQAADAIIAAEPEPMEYVRVCDAFGTGYFYIPGTETCLKVGGYIRFEVNFGEDISGSSDWDAFTRGRLEVISKSDTELGELTGFIAIHGEGQNQVTGEDDFYMDEAYLQLGGFKAGNYLNWWDANDLPGELDDLGSNRLNSIAYIYTGDAFTAGIQLDEIQESDIPGSDNELGLEAVIQASVGPVGAELLGSYDFGVEEGAIRAIGSLEAGPGTFYLSGIYSSNPNEYYSSAEWTVAAAYAWKATEKFEVIPEFQYFWSSAAADGSFTGDDYWAAGATVNYAVVENLTTKVSVAYHDDTESWGGLFRLQRDF
ncbi:porin [Neorhizobium sp. T786]|uniref:porin n=1 Tax=Pseudorhizobium xiangyangii TaxID=2883104 RepID=UPI001CFFF858|nr:porin [Neorhizobium xiangyangii]MCB5203407.1 porin [Neorhizobium xiangyangii]